MTLKTGKYKAVVPYSNYFSAALNGLGVIYPEADMVCDGKWCYFYRDGKKVWSCNVRFAKTFLLLTKKI